MVACAGGTTTAQVKRARISGTSGSRSQTSTGIYAESSGSVGQTSKVAKTLARSVCVPLQKVPITFVDDFNCKHPNQRSPFLASLVQECVLYHEDLHARWMLETQGPSVPGRKPTVRWAEVNAKFGCVSLYFEPGPPTNWCFQHKVVHTSPGFVRFNFLNGLTVNQGFMGSECSCTGFNSMSVQLSRVPYAIREIAKLGARVNDYFFQHSSAVDFYPQHMVEEVGRRLVGCSPGGVAPNGNTPDVRPEDGDRGRPEDGRGQ